MVNDGGSTMNKGSNKDSKNTVGWLDWKVALAMTLFSVLLLCSFYFDFAILRYIAIISAIYGVVRTFARVVK